MAISVDDRVAAHTKRQKDAGLVQVRVWTKPELRNQVKLAAAGVVGEGDGDQAEEIARLTSQIERRDRMLEAERRHKEIARDERDRALKETSSRALNLMKAEIRTLKMDLADAAKDPSKGGEKADPELKDGMVRLTSSVYPEKIQIIEGFVAAQNAAQAIINERG